MVETVKTWRLDGESVTLVFVAKGQENIHLAYLGPPLPDSENLDALLRSGQFGQHENQPDDPPVGGFLPDVDKGYRGTAALKLLRQDQSLDARFRLNNVHHMQDAISFHWTDDQNALELQLSWKLHAADMIYSSYTLRNNSKHPVSVAEMASLMLPVPTQYDRITAFPGRWAREMTAQTRPIMRGKTEFRSYGGKAGFGGGDWLVIEDSKTQNAIGYHFAWSGDHRILIEKNDDGDIMLVGGSAPEQSPIFVHPGEQYQTPAAIFSVAENGDVLTQKFHHHVRNLAVLHRSDQTGPRKVHLNSWEALGFDLSEAKILKLINQAADLGVERFVLDDGWFKARRNDTAGLGDWESDPNILPNGLEPVIDHARSLGMDFGLWVEPEMISPDSDLYRSNPEWCIHNDANDRPTERNQLVLDLTNPEAFEHIFTVLDGLLRNNAIAYLKWDHNRRQFPVLDNRHGSQSLQISALYQLFRRLRKSHPHIEIESCSSGGGRVDLAILSFCNRIWPSDNNDPIERLRINQNWTRFLPLEILGNHVGPSPNPVTGRRTDMDLRAKVALFGHMGVEANPADMSTEEREILRAHIEHYKQWRGVLHAGQFWQLDHTEQSIYGQIIVDECRAIAFAAQTAFAENFNVAPIQLKGLTPEASYKVTLPKPWPAKASQYLADTDLWNGKLILSGRALMESGLALPLTHPETAWLITLEEVV